MDQTLHNLDQWHKAAISIAVTVLVLTLLVAAPAAGQDEYYGNETNETGINNESWMENRTEATAENTTHMITRVGTFIIGGGTGSATGAILTSLLAGGIVIGMLGANQVGVVAGTTVGVTTLGAFASAGWAPPWIWALVVFGVGLLLTTLVIRSLR